MAGNNVFPFLPLPAFKSPFSVSVTGTAARVCRHRVPAWANPMCFSVILLTGYQKEVGGHFIALERVTLG